MPVAFERAGGLWDSYRTWLLLESDAAVGTIRVYRRICWDFAGPHGGYLAGLPQPKPWWKATDDDLRCFVDQAAESGPRKGQRRAAGTRANYIAAVKGLYRFAYAAGLLARDPMALVRYPQVGSDASRSFEREELAAILDAAELATDDDRLYPMAWVAFGAGLRCHAIAALKLEDFYPRPRPGRLLVVRKRRPGRHWVSLGTDARSALDRYLTGRRRQGRALVPGDPLFGNLRWPQQPLRPARVGELLADLIRERAGLERGSAHWLRHTAAETAVQASGGRNLEDVREFLDHAGSETTREYLKGVQWQMQDVADLLTDPRTRRP